MTEGKVDSTNRKHHEAEASPNTLMLPHRAVILSEAKGLQVLGAKRERAACVPYLSCVTNQSYARCPVLVAMYATGWATGYAVSRSPLRLTA